MLAMDLLHLRHRLGGPFYTEADVNRLTKGIARHAWLDRQLSDMRQEKCQSIITPHQGDEHGR